MKKIIDRIREYSDWCIYITNGICVAYGFILSAVFEDNTGYHYKSAGIVAMPGLLYISIVLTIVLLYVHIKKNTDREEVWAVLNCAILIPDMIMMYLLYARLYKQFQSSIEMGDFLDIIACGVGIYLLIIYLFIQKLDKKKKR